MKFLEAQKEFQVRYYLWAASEWEKAINTSLSNLCSFKSGSVWETCQFMQLLNRHDQLVLARGLLKRFHADAVKTLGENCSREEELLRYRRDEFFHFRQHYQFFRQVEKEGQMDVAGFWLQRLRADATSIPSVGCFNDDKSLLSELDTVFQRIPLTFEEEIAAKKKAGEKVRFASKRRLQEAITEKFKDAFGHRCVRHDYDDICDPSSDFDMECCGWILSTNFWFGRGKNLINYTQGISSPTRIQHALHPEISAPAMIMAQCVSLGAWLGITSQIQWEYITKDEVESTCEAVINCCRHFFDVAPKLLKGLEFENLTA